MFSFKAKMTNLFKREFPIVSGFVLLSIMISCDTSSAINVTPQDVLQKTYLSEINQLAPNAYVHFRNGVVLVESGMFVLPVRDLEIPIGGSSFVLERSYNNKASSKGIFGVGWKFNFGMRLEERGEQILSVEPGAGTVLFRKASNGTYVSDSRSYQTITKGRDGSFKSEDINGRVYHFDQRGKLVRVIDGHASFYLTYDKDRFMSIGDGHFPLVRFRYKSAGFVDEMEDPSGRKSRFEYNSEGNLIKEVSFRGETTKYQYDTQHQMSAVEYGNGAVVHIKYDSAGRAMSQKGPDNLTTTYQYVVYDNERRTTVIDALGNKMIYSFKNNDSRVEIADFGGKTIQKSYDQNGNLTEFKNQMGQVLRFTHTDKGRLSTKTGFDGKSEHYIYDTGVNKLVSVRAGAKEIKIAYNAAGLMARFEDAYGRITRYEYDTANNLKAIIEPGGRRTAFEYDQRGRMNKVISPDGTFQGYLYDMNGNVKSSTDVNGKAISYSYDNRGDLVKITDQVGGTEQMRYDDGGNLIERISAAGAKTKFSFNLFGQVIRIDKDQAGNRTTFHYDAKGRRKEVIYPNGGRIRYTHDAMDRITETSDQLGRSARYTYDEAGRVAEITYPGGRQARYKYDHRGLLIETSVQGRGKTGYTHDELNRLVSIKAHDGETRFDYNSRDQLTAILDSQSGYKIAYRYDDLGNIIETDDTRSGKTFFRYDQLDRLLEVKAESGYKEEYSYDKSANIIESKIAGREIVKNYYDPVGRVVKSDSKRYGQTSYTYDPVGNLIGLVDASGAKKEFEYDKVANQLIKVVENGVDTRYKYDLAGNLRVMVDANGNETRFEYDKVGRLVKSIDPLGGKREIQYDPEDRVIKMAREDGKTEKFVHNESGLLIKALVSDKPVKEISYDRLNRVIREKGEGYSFSYVHDAAGNLIEKKDDLNNVSVRYAYDQANNLVGVELPDGKKISYTYDKLNNLSGIAGADGTLISIRYDRFNRRGQIKLGGTATVKYDYNGNGTVRSIRYQKPDGSPIYSIHYEYDVAGRISRVDYNGQAFSYAYDELSRLRKAKYPDGKTEIYGYDPSGNIIGVNTSKLSYNAANQLTARDDTRFTYDLLGNLIEKKDKSAAVRYAYTDTGKLKSVLLPGNKSVAYQRDADGNLMMRQTDGSKKYFLNDRDDVLVEMADGQVHAVYLTGTTLDERLAKLAGEKRHYYITDINKSVLAVMDETGEIENSYLYEPFGKVRELKEKVENDFYFQGRFYDKQVGLYDYRARIYDPDAMRFVQEDPYPGSVQDPISLNHYVFVKNNPVNFVDPLGLIELKEAWDAVRSWSKKTTCLSEVCEKFQAGKIGPMIYGKVPEGFESVGLVERRGWLYEVLKSADPGKSGRFRTIFRDLSQKAEGFHGQGDFAGYGASEAALSRSSMPEYMHPDPVDRRSFIEKIRGGIQDLRSKGLQFGQDVKHGLQLYGSQAKEHGKEITATVGTLGGLSGLLKTGIDVIASMPGGKSIIGIAIGVSGVTGYGIGTALNELKPVSDAAVSLINAVTGYGKQSEFPTGEEYGQRGQEIVKTKIRTSIDRIKKSDLPFDTETEIAESTPQVGYNPLDDPNLKSGGKESINIAEADELGKEFQEGQGGGNKTTTAQDPQNVIQQPESYTADPAKKPESPGSTQQSPSQPYPPGYPPDTGSGTAQVPWDKLVGESSGHGAKTPGGSGSYGSSRSLNPPSPPPSSGMPPKTPVSTSTGKNEPTQAELKAAYNEGCRVGRQVRNGELSSAAVKELMRTTYDKGHKSLKDEFKRGWGDCSK